ncbi:MAG TPA: DUF3604 domain-containing protein [Candidatus Limnocylindrales bacterium]|nr:DUF3604 domain-containing protein [Candidatus Limnocylindrales bacterium]
MQSIARYASLPAALGLACLFAGCEGKSQGPGTIEGKALPVEVVAARGIVEAKAATAIAKRVKADLPEKQILFGDLHVHTTYSADAFMMSLPIMQGEGVHPVADACDFARYCSSLDFWSINDHAESITPKRWRETIDSIRQCNAIAGDPASPDVVAYLGWEWTQIGLTAEEHYGHRNVILKDLDDGKITRRPIAASAFSGQAMRDAPPWNVRYLLPHLDWANRHRYYDLLKFQDETRETPVCQAGVDTKSLPDDCMEFAATPAELLEKLAQSGVESMVIPHGTTWGIYTPPGYTFDKSLAGRQHDEEQQRLIEVFSGHGNSEEHRPWREATRDEQGRLACPEPTAEYEPCCWRAGEIIRSRCADPQSAECQRRVEQARADYLAAGASGRLSVPGADVPEWGACGVCRDCYLPSFEYRAGGAVQYIMALSNFEDPAKPRRFHFGFIASSDNHSARPGTGYKEFDRQEHTESFGPRSSFWRDQSRPLGDPEETSLQIDPNGGGRFQRFQLLDFERGSSFFYTGGLVAVHSPGRDRDSIWNALESREVYGTSGERILLWFDMINSPTGKVAMGSQVQFSARPRFRVRAVGSLKQKPGCPDHAASGLSAERLQKLCGGECYNPTDERYRIKRLEIVRIQPQTRPDEPVEELIQDPWKTIPCSGERIGCVAEFEDFDFPAERRDTLYYVRALQEATPTVNAGNLRCRTDETGKCVSIDPCYGDWRTDYEDDCLADAEERAWSSPIFLHYQVDAATPAAAQPVPAPARPTAPPPAEAPPPDAPR